MGPTLFVLICTSIIGHIALANGTELDISKDNNIIFQAFECYYDDIPTKFIFPREEVYITLVTDGSIVLWESKEEEVCRLVMLRLKNGTPVIAHISPMDRNTHQKKRWLELHRVDGIWKTGLFNSFVFINLKRDRVLETLREVPRSTSSFSLDLSVNEDNEKFQVSDYYTGKVPSRIHIPQLSHYASEVRYGEETLWKATRYGENASATVTFIKKGEPCMVQIVFSDSSKLNSRYYVKKDYGWLAVSEYEFELKMSKWPNDDSNAGNVEGTSEASGKDSEKDVDVEAGLAEKLMPKSD